jgi:hypothetical protein
MHHITKQAHNNASVSQLWFCHAVYAMEHGEQVMYAFVVFMEISEQVMYERKYP